MRGQGPRHIIGEAISASTLWFRVAALSVGGVVSVAFGFYIMAVPLILLAGSQLRPRRFAAHGPGTRGVQLHVVTPSGEQVTAIGLDAIERIDVSPLVPNALAILMDGSRVKLSNTGVGGYSGRAQLTRQVDELRSRLTVSRQSQS